MALASSDLFVVHRGGNDYKYDYDSLYNDIHAGDKAVNDGKLTIKDAEGNTLGEFTANQDGPTDINLPANFSGSWNDLTDKPCIYECDTYIPNLDELP